MKGSTPIPHDPGLVIPDALERAMSRCAGSAKQDVKFTVGDYRFRLKPRATTIKIYATGSNDRGYYVGSISNHHFAPISTLSGEERSAILHILQNPKQAAIDHGRTTGCCAICGIALTDPASLLIGIGPICLGNWGWDDDAMSLEDLL